MGITSMDNLVQALTGSQRFDMFKAQQTSEGAGTWHSYWAATGTYVGGSPPSTSGSVCHASTSGAWPLSNPASGTMWLAQVAVSGNNPAKLIIYDRLWHNKGLATIVASSATWTAAGASVSRPDSYGEGAEIWLEFYVAPGVTAATITATYKNSSGSAGRTAYYQHPANAETVNQIAQMTLQAGDTGVAKVYGYACTATTGAAGDVGITVVRRLAEIPLMASNVGMYVDFAGLGMPTIYPSACIGLIALCNTTVAPYLQGLANVITGSW